MANSNHVISVDLRLLTNNFDSALSYVQNRARTVFGSIADNANGSFIGGAFNTAAWAAAFSFIQQAGIMAFRAIGKEINRGIEYQNNLISNASSYGTLLNLNFKSATALAKKANVIFQQENVGLPFERVGAQFRANYGDDFLAAFYDPKDEKASLQRTASLLGRLQVLIGGTTGTTNYQQTAFIGNVLSDKFSKLSRLEVFRNNPQLQRVFNSEIAKVGGVENFDKMGRNERIGILENITGQALPDEIMNAYKNTLGGVFSRLKQQLFGDLGLFSITRNLIFNMPDSNIITSLTKFFAELFKSNGIFGTIKAAVGGVIDRFLIGFKLTLDIMTAILKPINLLFMALQPLNPLIYALTFALTTLATVGLANNIYRIIQGILIQSGAAAFGSQLGMAAMLGKGGDLVGMSMLAKIGFGKTLMGVKGIVKGLDNLADVGWVTISNGFRLATVGVAKFGLSLLGLLANPVFLTVTGVLLGIALIGFTIYKNWKPLDAFFKGFWDGFSEVFTPANEMLMVFNDLLSGIGEALRPITNAFVGLYNAMKPALDGINGFFNMNQYEATEENFSTGKQIGRTIGGATNFGLRTIMAPLTPLLNLFGGGAPVPNNADGNMSPLLSAIDREVRSGSGGSIAIANTTEAILNRGQQETVARSIVGGGGANITNHFNITGSNGQDIAQQIMNILNTQWSSAQRENA